MSLGRLDRAGSLLSSVVDDRSLLSSAGPAGHSGHGTIPRSHSLVQSIAEVVRVSLDPVPGTIDKTAVWGLYCMYAIVGLMYGFVSNYINIPICQYVFGPLGEPGRASIQQCNISVSLTQMPWNFKIFYGLLLDRITFFGSRRKGWIIFGWSSSILILACMSAVAQNLADEGNFATYMMLLMVMCFFYIFSDVAGDGMTIELSKLEHGMQGFFLMQKPQAPWQLYLIMALLLGLSQGLGKVTFRYLNYATNTVVKSAKLVPTLIISVTWLRRSISCAQWVAALLLVMSSALMALGEQAAAPSFNPTGLVIAAVQLLCAALQGNMQEKALKDHGASITEAMAYSNGLGMVVVFVAMQVSGEAAPAFEFFMSSKFALSLLLLRSATFFIGAVSLTAITKEHGTGAATAVGTARKSLTVLLSFMIFPKPFHVNYVLGTLAFVLADIIYLQVSSARLAKNKIVSQADDDIFPREKSVIGKDVGKESV